MTALRWKTNAFVIEMDMNIIYHDSMASIKYTIHTLKSETDKPINIVHSTRFKVFFSFLSEKTIVKLINGVVDSRL